ncbi:Lipoma-preferred partner -like protein [Takifugu flavidus]|uniref:Lipoma-preferred partner-like protein n=1 Tax=Takifugu flavidus TaxID=433684 RepID=A0A5C6MRQ9_9TELE|nr:Lipoma-preferred partner -like protein [Takifugu flavidus]
MVEIGSHKRLQAAKFDYIINFPYTYNELQPDKVKGPEKTLEERRSSLDAEIDSLTSILADLESSSPYKPRSTQTYISGYTQVRSANRTQATKLRIVRNLDPQRSGDWIQTDGHPDSATSDCYQEDYTQSPGGGASATPPSSASPVAKPQSFTPPQPVPASYATASTPSQPTFNVQVRSAQPGPQHQAPGGPTYGQQPIRTPAQVQYMPAQPRGPDFAYGPPQPGFSPMSHGGYQEHHQPGIVQGGGMSTRRPEPLPAQQYQPPGPKKTYITDVPPSLSPYNSGPTIPPKWLILPDTSWVSLLDPSRETGSSVAHPEDELERLTKKMLFDMDNPPSEEYFADSSWLLLKRRWVRVENRGRRTVPWLNGATVELTERNKEDEGRSLRLR